MTTAAMSLYAAMRREILRTGMPLTVMLQSLMSMMRAAMSLTVLIRMESMMRLAVMRHRQRARPAVLHVRYAVRMMKPEADRMQRMKLPNLKMELMTLQRRKLILTRGKMRTYRRIREDPVSVRYAAPRIT